MYETDFPVRVDLYCLGLYNEYEKQKWGNSLIICNSFIFVFYNKYEKEIFGMEKFNTQKNLEKKTIGYVERMIELIKFTHYPRTKEDIAKFLFEENSKNKNKEINEYLKWDAKDENSVFQIFDTDIPVHFYERKQKGKVSTWISGMRETENNVMECAKTIHPVFLALNATEVFLLTQILLSIALKHDSNYYEAYKNIVKKIQRQLSPYMSAKIDWTLLDEVPNNTFMKKQIVNINESMRFDAECFLRIDMSEDEEEYWETIQDDSKNTTYGTLENAVSLMKYMHLPKTRDEINNFMGMDVFLKEITLNGSPKRRGYWKSENHGDDYFFLNVGFPFCKAKAANKDLIDIGYISTAGDFYDNSNLDKDRSNYFADSEDYYQRIVCASIEEYNKSNEINLQYQQTVHPIFMVLSIDEIFLLTVNLLKLVHEEFKYRSNYELDEVKQYKDTTFLQYINIVKKIYHQLSDYAKNVLSGLDPEFENEYHILDLKSKEKNFISEKNYNSKHGVTDQNLIMFLKTGELYWVDTVDGLVLGRIILDSNDSEEDAFFVKEKNGIKHKIIV